MRSLVPAPALLVALAACGGNGGGFTGQADAAAPADGQAPGADGPTATPDAAASDAHAAGDGAPAAKNPSTMLYPLAVGYTWTYDVAAVGAGAVCAPGTSTSKVTGVQTLNARPAFDVASFCAAAGTSELSIVPDTDEVDVDYQGAWLTLVDPRLQEGETWSFYNSSYTWHRETSVTVPAGTFTDCWTAKQNVSYTAYMTYCRGAGMVHSYSADLTGAGWDAKLAAKSF
jgi:hypothetical protein